MLTIKKLKKMEPNTIFAQGETIDSPEGINMARTGKRLKWVAVRGQIHDWAIYIGTLDQSIEDIRDWGDKVTGEENIKKLVECDKEAFGAYRY